MARNVSLQILWGDHNLLSGGDFQQSLEISTANLSLLARHTSSHSNHLEYNWVSDSKKNDFYSQKGKLIMHINLGRAHVLSFCTQSKPIMDSSAHRRWEIPQYIWDGTQDYLLPLPLHVCPPAHEVVVSLGSVWVLCSAQAAQSSGETSFSHSAHFHPPSHYHQLCTSSPAMMPLGCSSGKSNSLHLQI